MELGAGLCEGGAGLGEVRCESGAGAAGEQETGKLQEKGVSGFGSEVAVAVALARRSSVVASLSVAMPLVLPALPPALVVVAPVAVRSPGWNK